MQTENVQHVYIIRQFNLGNSPILQTCASSLVNPALKLLLFSVKIFGNWAGVKEKSPHTYYPYVKHTSIFVLHASVGLVTCV